MTFRRTTLYDRFEPAERLTLLLEAMARKDESEVERLQRSCPRASYTAQDPAFEDRWTMAFDILAVVSIDLRAAWAKLDVLRWVIESVHPVATGHHVTASLAFVDGIRCGKGLPQCEFFARPLPGPRGYDPADLDVPHEDDEGGIDEDCEDQGVTDPAPRQIDQGLRLDAIERRSEHFTACGLAALLDAAGGIARDMVNIWAAFGIFCRTRIGVEPETMLRAWRFPFDDFLATLKRYDKVKPDPKKVKEYTGYISKQWDRRFRRSGPDDEFDVDADTGDDDEEDANG